MRIELIIISLIHGLIHSLGFVKGFEFKEIKELSSPISKEMGILWLISSLLFLLYTSAIFFNHKYSWFIGFIAVLLSQFLIILFWKDAKFGTLPNFIILIASIISYGNYSFEKMVQLETNIILDKNKLPKEKLVSENDLNKLPYAVKKWLNSSGIIGKPYINIGKVFQKAEMKLKPEQTDWLKATAIQYSTIDNPSFIWSVSVKMNNFINFKGRDKFEDGKGNMLIKLNSIINIVNEKGTKLDEGTIQRYLGEMVWFPSLALSPYITWKEINKNTAIAIMEYKGTKCDGTFYFNNEGDFIKYTTLRYKGNKPEDKRYEWVLLVDEYKTFNGIKIPSKMKATWKLENTDWTWLKLDIIDIKYNKDI
ncbi:MAG: DUF6544 family protein [Candidatus Sericytochromatia bacterium]